MYRLIPGPIYNLYIFPQIVTPFLITILIQIYAPISYLYEMLVMKLWNKNREFLFLLIPSQNKEMNSW